MAEENREKSARGRRLVAVIGRPPSIEAARADIAALPEFDVIVTDDITTHAAAALEKRLRTLDTRRAADAIAADADHVIDYRAPVIAEQDMKPWAEPTKAEASATSDAPATAGDEQEER